MFVANLIILVVLNFLLGKHGITLIDTPLDWLPIMGCVVVLEVLSFVKGRFE